MKFRLQNRGHARQQEGYILLTLLLIMALLAIAASVAASKIAFDIKRDREQEMINRGVQYSRAIRQYYKKFGRYPMKLEDLENTNQMRFLRKRYKDPLTGKDFKILHYGEAKMTLNGIGGGVIPGASTLGANGTLTPNGGGMGQPSTLGGSPSTLGLGTAAGNTLSSGMGQNAQGAAGQPAGTDASGQNSGTQDSSSSSSSSSSSGTPNFGGMPIVGVASLSKERTIREFDHKTKYNEWQFVYDPTLDRGFLITTPYQPQLQMFGTGPQNVNGTTPAGQSGNSFGTGFGNSPSPMQNNPTSPLGGSHSAPSSSPQQQ